MLERYDDISRPAEVIDIASFNFYTVDFVLVM